MFFSHKTIPLMWYTTFSMTQNWAISLSSKRVLVNCKRQNPEVLLFNTGYRTGDLWDMAVTHSYLGYSIPVDRIHCHPIRAVLLRECSDTWTCLSLRISITYLSHYLFLTLSLDAHIHASNLLPFQNINLSLTLHAWSAHEPSSSRLQPPRLLAYTQDQWSLLILGFCKGNGIWCRCAWFLHGRPDASPAQCNHDFLKR